MDAGELRHRITLQQKTVARDAMGGEIETWNDIATVWASKAHQTSREFFAAQKINAEITVLFIIRYRRNVDTKMRVIFSGKTYDILGADDLDGRRRELWLMAKVVK